MAFRLSPGRGGFSLIETVVAVTLFLLTMLVVLTLMPSAWLGVKSGGERLFANNLAQSRLDELRAAEFTSYTVGEILPPTVDQGAEYHTFLDIEYYKDPPPSRTQCLPQDALVKVLILEVRWQTQRGRQLTRRKVSVCKLPR